MERLNKRELLKNENEAFQPPDGEVLDACFSHRQHTIHISSGNAPYEEMLTIRLYDADQNCLETIELYSAYAPGCFCLKNVETDGVTFTFWNDQPLTLKWLQSPARQLWRPAGVHYQNPLARRHLVIES